MIENKAADKLRWKLKETGTDDMPFATLWFQIEKSLMPFAFSNIYPLLIKSFLFFHVPVIADLYPCIKDHATHTKSRGLMSLPLTRSASRPLMRRAKGPSPMFTHSLPHVLLQLL